MRDIDALIRERAYLIWENSGKPAGLERDHWFQAAREIEEAMARDPFAVTAVESMPETSATPEAGATNGTEAMPPAQSAPQGEAGPAPARKAGPATKRMPLKMPQPKKK